MNLKLPGNLKHYDGNERPDTWIEDYYNVVTFAEELNIARRMLQLYLVGPARIWLSDLEKNSIVCWFDLKNAFEKHFRGTYKRPATTSDLQACIQKKGETSRSFLTRWLQTRNQCENVDNRTAMHAFIGGLQRGGYKRARKHRPRGKGGKGKNKDKEEDSSKAMDEDDASPDHNEELPGSITLHVAFGDVNNFREEMITFEVVPFKSSYHVIFGRPTYHKFHARACYIYNKLKIPGPNGATYQRTMQRCLKDQIGRNVHAYVDDIAVMTQKGSDLISDLTETFENLRRFEFSTVIRGGESKKVVTLGFLEP
ncbi:hypothetical protein QYE76_030677 [Lolium multiflorum]|uniref:Retrotransposon gag domain-containing protein n=1 Tax=Lolium multiflorum TaxID=4521 RepID=A0AAD8QTJ4_LOLMU|nr:hypothetical protein QYE76_030677 [Lolium multiflorum]